MNDFLSPANPLYLKMDKKRIHRISDSALKNVSFTCIIHFTPHNCHYSLKLNL